MDDKKRRKLVQFLLIFLTFVHMLDNSGIPVLSWSGEMPYNLSYARVCGLNDAGVVVTDTG